VVSEAYDAEQAHLDFLHERLDERRAHAQRQLSEAFGQPGGTRQAQVERGASVNRLTRQIARYDAAENGLCFGRLDLGTGERRYVGRIGLPADDRDEDPLLVDWRAPAARPFYTATAHAAQGVRRRRHLHTRGRRITRLDDELLDEAGPSPSDQDLVGEAALMAALTADRTGRMQGAVATLQAEQDAVIRAPHHGVLVVQGGPGTGKTVVALHRAAYLLYSRPDLERRGVLVVGPNPVFLGYVGEVLPGLGETSVLLASVQELMPGVVADAEEPVEVAALKGRLRMAEVLARAVRARQAVVDGPMTITVAGERMTLAEADLRAAAERARGSRRPHNVARRAFRARLLDLLAGRMARVSTDLQEQYEAELLERIDVAALDRAVAADLASVTPEWDEENFAPAQEHDVDWRPTVAQEDAVQTLIDDLWPSLTPRQLLGDLLASPFRMAEAGLSPAEIALLTRDIGSPWTAADVPLLDEAAELLGVDREAAEAAEAERRAEAEEFAQGVLDLAAGSRAQEDEVTSERLSAADLVDAAGLASWNQEADRRTVAERAAADRTWAFGHVIVDEAQELSPMTWRLLVRRCPTRSFTVVGDVAQASSAAGSSSWAQGLAPFFGDRWRLEQLTVNYRTPTEIMAAAEPVRRAISADLRPARAVRSTPFAPRRIEVDGGLAGAVAEVTAHERAVLGDGRLAVIVTDTRLAEVTAAVTGRVPDASWGRGVDLEARVVVLTPRQAKGLEFDTVVLADPGAIVSAGAKGLNDLYVALTRPTRRLLIVHDGPVPPMLAAVGT
jgi:DNA helicase IV